MKKTIIIFLSLFMISCGSTNIAIQMSKIPYHENTWQIQERDTWPTTKNTSIAIKIFYKRWKKDFGDKEQGVYKALNNLMIEWVSPSDKEILGYSMDGKVVRGKVKGIALSPTYIKVRKTQYERIASTSLMHELTHVALWNSGKILGDPDHEGPAYSGWTNEHTKMIKELNRLLANINI